MLWATHELTHMRVRRANALFSTADIILRQRIQTFQARVEEEAAFARMQQEGRNVFGHTSPTPLGWRDLVEQELAVNALWVVGELFKPGVRYRNSFILTRCMPQSSGTPGRVFL